MNSPGPLECPYCSGLAHLQSSELIWPGRGFPPLYICENYPRCDSYVRCHDGTFTPLGTVAGPRLRKLRGLAHRLFDPVWQDHSNPLGRPCAYEVAAEVMGVQGEFHIGELDEAQCERFIELVDEVHFEVEKRIQTNCALIDSATNPQFIELLLAIFNPQDGEYLRSVPLETVSIYANLLDQAVKSGAVTINDDCAVLTDKGRRLLYDDSYAGR